MNIDCITLMVHFNNHQKACTTEQSRQITMMDADCSYNQTIYVCINHTRKKPTYPRWKPFGKAKASLLFLNGTEIIKAVPMVLNKPSKY